MRLIVDMFGGCLLAMAYCFGLQGTGLWWFWGLVVILAGLQAWSARLSFLEGVQHGWDEAMEND